LWQILVGKYFLSLSTNKCNPSFPFVSKDVKQCLQDITAIHDNSAECHKSLNKYELTKIEDQNHIVIKANFMDATPEMNCTMKCRKDCVPKFVADPGMKIFFESLNQHLSMPMTISMDTHTETSKIASLRRFGKFGFYKIHDSVSQYASHLLNHSVLPNAFNLVDDLHIHCIL
jgi:hypothetical protein